MEVIKLINITGTKNASFPVGDHEISSFADIYLDHDNYGSVIEKSRPITASFKLNKGYGVTFYKDPQFRGPDRSFYAGDYDINIGLMGPNLEDRTIDGMRFDNSIQTMINNIKSMKVFIIPTKIFCGSPDVSSRDICEAIWGEGIIKSVGTQYKNGPVINTMQWGKAVSNYVPEDVPEPQPDGISPTLLIAIILVIIASIGGYYLIGKKESDRRFSSTKYRRNYLPIR